MELRQYIAIGLKWWWLIVLLTVIAAGSGYVFSNRQTPVYEATTTLMVGQSIQSVTLDRADILTSQFLARTYADMARRQPVLNGVIEALSLGESWQELEERVRTQLVRDTQLLQITVAANSPEEARITADEIAHQLILLSPTSVQNQEREEHQGLVRQRLEGLQGKIEAGQQRLATLEATMAGSLSAEQVKELQAEINDLEQLIADWENNYTQLLIFAGSEKSPNYLAVIEPAQASSQPVRPRPLRDTFLAAVVGFLLALGLIFLVEYLDDTLKSADDLNQSLGLITLGMVGQVNGKQHRQKLITMQEPFSPASEAYRMIRSNIQFMSVDSPARSVMVTSATGGEGKSVTVANLGIVMAQANLKTIIVDADLRRPVQHQIFQIPNKGGLTECLRSSEPLRETHLRSTSVENLQVMTSGVIPPNPAELLGSQRMGELLSSLNALADIVIYDSPPALVVTDAAVLSSRVDGTVLVIKAGSTRRDAAGQALFNLQQAGANVLGGILNQVPRRGRGYYYQGYYTPHKSAPAGQPAQTTRRRWQWLPFFK